MQTRKDRWQAELFVAGRLEGLIPEDHLLRQVDRVVDLSWLHEEVRDCYSQDNGRPSIDPESALRLMLAGFFEGIVHDRKLMRRAQTDVAFRWFAGYRLDEQLPDHSSLTRIRQRWGAARFKRVFAKTVQACVKAGLVNAETVHVDATLIRADVSWDSLTTEHVERVLETNQEEEEHHDKAPPTKRPGRPRTKPPKAKKRSTTDPEATMATSNKGYHLEPAYKQHTAVEDRSGVIVDVAVTTGEENEGGQVPEQLRRVEDATGDTAKTVTADASYAHAANYAALEASHVDAIIPPQRVAPKKKGKQRLPARRFKYDAHHGRVRCPGGKYLHRKGRTADGRGYWYRSRACDCAGCPLKQRCLSEKTSARTLMIVDGFPALVRARRRREKGWDEPTRQAYTRHRWRVEGTHGRAKAQHGLRRAARRGLANVAIQAYLTAAAMNLKRLAAALAPRTLLIRLVKAYRRLHRPTTARFAPA